MVDKAPFLLKDCLSISSLRLSIRPPQPLTQGSYVVKSIRTMPDAAPRQPSPAWSCSATLVSPSSESSEAGWTTVRHKKRRSKKARSPAPSPPVKRLSEAIPRFEQIIKPAADDRPELPLQVKVYLGAVEDGYIVRARRRNNDKHRYWVARRDAQRNLRFEFTATYYGRGRANPELPSLVQSHLANMSQEGENERVDGERKYPMALPWIIRGLDYHDRVHPQAVVSNFGSIPYESFARKETRRVGDS